MGGPVIFAAEHFSLVEHFIAVFMKVFKLSVVYSIRLFYIFILLLRFRITVFLCFLFPFVTAVTTRSVAFEVVVLSLRLPICNKYIFSHLQCLYNRHPYFVCSFWRNGKTPLAPPLSAR